MRACERVGCQESFRLAATGRPARFCSSRCRRLAWEQERAEAQQRAIEEAVEAERARAAEAQREAVVAAVARAVAAERQAQFRSDGTENRRNETPPAAPPAAPPAVRPGPAGVVAQELPLPVEPVVEELVLPVAVDQPHPARRPWVLGKRGRGY